MLKEKTQSIIEEHFSAILTELGLDLSDPSLEKTPERVAKMYLEELFTGLRSENFPKLSFTDFYPPEPSQHLVIIKDIRVQSICMHHFLPFTGTCTLAYVPNGKILGLSKINRIVDFFCRKPQLQEKLTEEILNCFATLLETNDITVEIQATHHCVTMRGVRDSASSTQTKAFRGKNSLV